MSQELFDRFVKCAVDVLSVDASKITVEASFGDDLDADSLDLVELVMALEEEFGIEVILPNPEFIANQKENLLGIVLTHAHEDHVGAIAHLWPMLECPIYATPFTAAIVKEKFKEKKINIGSYLKIDCKLVRI